MATKECTDDDDLWLPEEPEKPLPSDCCGSGCSPCVMDIFEEDMARWIKLKSLTVLERKLVYDDLQRKKKDDQHRLPALNPGKFFSMEILSIVRETKDSFLYKFKLPEGRCLGLSTGQHIVARYENGVGYCEYLLKMESLSPDNTHLLVH
jgi:cytochrome-b5 reductase